MDGTKGQRYLVFHGMTGNGKGLGDLPVIESFFPIELIDQLALRGEQAYCLVDVRETFFSFQQFFRFIDGGLCPIPEGLPKPFVGRGLAQEIHQFIFGDAVKPGLRSEEHTSELQSLV